MIARVAESCFWLNRYAERVETLARMLDVNAAFQLDVDLPDAQRWRPLVVVIGQERQFTELTPRAQMDDGEVVQQYLTWNEDNPSSILSSLRGARENARTIREVVSLEMWETLNELWVWMREPAARRLYDVDRHEFYTHLRDQCLLFHGTAEATMLHEHPFEFMRLGTALERAQQTARVLDVKYHSMGPAEDVESAAEAANWLATLRFCSGVEPFFKREANVVSGHAIAAFLLLERAFPRSVLHNLEHAQHLLDLVRGGWPGAPGGRTHDRLEGVLERVREIDVDALMSVQGLHEEMTWIVDETARVCSTLTQDMFDPAPWRPYRFAGESAA
jgi:uncharacterized alpha-E superfamily protein